ncbi:MAG TPA: glycosyl hydrolase family 65 protein [Acidimicrobiales bacterium]|nr:glycosyl hydrolase family 65 protein [Acidimicrobiales bacterium]
MRPGLDRRFEAVLVSSTAPEVLARAAPSLRALAGAGVLVGVTTPLAVDELRRVLAWPSTGAADLVVADSGESGLAVIDESGSHPVVDPTSIGNPGTDPAWGRPEEAVVETLDELWRRGVHTRDVVVLIDGASGQAPGPSPTLVPDLRVVTEFLAARETTAPVGVVSLTDGLAQLHEVLEDQRRRRRRRDLPEATTRPGWALVVDGFDVTHERVEEALVTLADGLIGTSGASLAPHQAQHPWVVAAGVYDEDGADTHLLTGPRVFELAGMADGAPLRRVLDLRTGVLHERTSSGGSTVDSVRFASLSEPSTSVLRVRCPKGLQSGPPLMAPTADAVHDQGRSGAATWMQVAASTGGITAAACQTRTRGGMLDRIAAYRSGTDRLPGPGPVVDALDQAATVGFDHLIGRHRRAWARRWEDADVVVEGDDEMQLAVRLALFHLMASVADTGEAAVGARGLTGTGYRGHVFWDADTFVLPFLAATHPAAARAMLEYRVRRIPAAMDAALAAGRAGARFPWESARSGRDVTPTSARDRTGRIVPIRTGQLEEHIVADVSWAAYCYADWSGDEEFVRGSGLRILVETARYWASRIRLESDGRAHIYGVIGPDEYHEPVDDNAYTNVMARWNLRRAAAAEGADDVDVGERQKWLQLADALVDGYDPGTGLYEQFAGFGRLEPLIIEDVAPRRPIAADMLLGAERVARAQVIKQADVLLLHHLVPDEVAPDSLGANLRFYEPRTAHGSSLSPATHASLFARARQCDKALEALRLAARMDLDDLTGSTAAGLHLATMGGLWQALAFGFAGLRPRDGMLHVDPVLPTSWSALELRVRFRGGRVRVRADHSRLRIHADQRTAVVVGGAPCLVGPGSQEFRYRSGRWERSS